MVLAMKTTLLQDHTLQVQEMITIPDHTVLAQSSSRSSNSGGGGGGRSTGGGGRGGRG